MLASKLKAGGFSSKYDIEFTLLFFFLLFLRVTAVGVFAVLTAGITPTSCYPGDVSKCAKLCRSMQGRLFVVLFGQGDFIKACAFVYTYTSMQSAPTGIHSHMHWIHCSLECAANSESAEKGVR